MPVAPIYEPSPAGTRLRQGHVLSEFTEWQVTLDEQGGLATPVAHPYVLVVTQDCDLEQDANARENPDLPAAKRLQQQLTHVLLVVAEEFEVSGRFENNSKLKAKAKHNQEPRLQYLAPCAPSDDTAADGFPALLLDFKRLFSVPFEHLVEGAPGQTTRRRACLRTPYAEHLSVRLGYFLQRVALPVDHHDATLPEVLALTGPSPAPAPGTPALTGPVNEPAGAPPAVPGPVTDAGAAPGPTGTVAPATTAPEPPASDAAGDTPKRGGTER